MPPGLRTTALILPTGPQSTFLANFLPTVKVHPMQKKASPILSIWWSCLHFTQPPSASASVSVSRSEDDEPSESWWEDSGSDSPSSCRAEVGGWVEAGGRVEGRVVVEGGRGTGVTLETWSGTDVFLERLFFRGCWFWKRDLQPLRWHYEGLLVGGLFLTTSHCRQA